MKSINHILSKALDGIILGQGIRAKIFSIIGEIISSINKSSKDFKAVLGGSAQKALIENFDADIFVLFNTKIPGQKRQIVGNSEKS